MYRRRICVAGISVSPTYNYTRRFLSPPTGAADNQMSYVANSGDPAHWPGSSPGIGIPVGTITLTDGDNGHGPYIRFDPHLSVFCSKSRMKYAGGRVEVTSPIVARRQPRREFRAPEPPGLDPGKPPSALLPPARVHIRCVRSFLRRSPTKRRIGFSGQTSQKRKSLNLVFPNAPVHSLSLLPRSIRCAKP
jgi:hypothetical protein